MALIGALAGYLLGSISPGLLVGRLYGIDVRDYGSGKTGFTNTLRAVGVVPAAVVIVADIGKGTVAVLIGSLLLDDPWAAALGGVAVVVGHNWPLFAGFRGGRGVATAFGAFLAMDPVAALILLVVAGGVLAATRYMSLVSVVGVFAGLIALSVRVGMEALPREYLLFGVLVTVLVELNHIGNMRRLLTGTEPKLGQGGEARGQPDA